MPTLVIAEHDHNSLKPATLHTVAAAELAKKKAEATGVRIEGFTASELADVESALTWIGQNKESKSSDPA